MVAKVSQSVGLRQAQLCRCFCLFYPILSTEETAPNRFLSFLSSEKTIKHRFLFFLSTEEIAPNQFCPVLSSEEIASTGFLYNLSSEKPPKTEFHPFSALRKRKRQLSFCSPDSGEEIDNCLLGGGSSFALVFLWVEKLSFLSKKNEKSLGKV